MKKPQLVWDIKPVSYILGKDAVKLSKKRLEEYNKRIVLVDENTQRHCLPVFEEQMEGFDIDGVIIIKANASNKSIDQTVHVWNELSRLGAERDTLLINLGGGVVSDLGGFAAATFKRGINFVNFPTSLLGMVDAAIGGKTGLDFGGIKNQVGLFINPVCVIIDPVFLKTLDQKQLLSGYAELLKCGLIMDKDLWETVENVRYNSVEEWDSLIVQSARNKVDIVRHDTYEKGLRKILNFGHTVGHAIESFLINKGLDITHGEAVAAGMICETYISSKFYEFECTRIKEIINTIDNNFDRFDLKKEDIPVLLELMQHDKKNKDGKYHFSLLRRLGKAVHDIEVDDDLIRESIEFYIEKKECESEEDNS
ncbi:MAG: 3-dehydroquinate synthase [Marinilabiliales bacterium]|nr:MAG: 3-dehydroquinate synthase [Marinilabiliales bacterium]